jgi:hypothetical protein
MGITERNTRSAKSLCFYMQLRCGNQEPRELIHEVIPAFSRKTEHLAFLRSFLRNSQFLGVCGKGNKYSKSLYYYTQPARGDDKLRRLIQLLDV